MGKWITRTYIRKHREALGWTREQLSEASDKNMRKHKGYNKVSVARLVTYETMEDNSTITLSAITLLATTMGVAPTDLYSSEEENPVTQIRLSVPSIKKVLGK